MKKIILAALALGLSACGGGSGGSSSSASNITELEGTWVYSTGSHLTGGSCGLDIHGDYEIRTTLRFSGTNINAIGETCAILQGNTGSFVQTNTLAGTFSTGNVYLTYGAESYKALDIAANNTVRYSGYFLNSNQLKLAETTVGNDGSTSGKRLNGVGLSGQPIYLKQAQ